MNGFWKFRYPWGPGSETIKLFYMQHQHSYLAKTQCLIGFDSLNDVIKLRLVMGKCSTQQEFSGSGQLFWKIHSPVISSLFVLGKKITIKQAWRSWLLMPTFLLLYMIYCNDDKNILRPIFWLYDQPSWYFYSASLFSLGFILAVLNFTQLKNIFNILKKEKAKSMQMKVSCQADFPPLSSHSSNFKSWNISLQKYCGLFY